MFQSFLLNFYSNCFCISHNQEETKREKRVLKKRFEPITRRSAKEERDDKVWFEFNSGQGSQLANV